nr:hypothetical protein Iba_chr01dCG1360 [Ipomoea batatas]
MADWDFSHNWFFTGIFLWARLICRNLSTEFTDLGMVVESMDVCSSTGAIKIGKLAIWDSKDSTFIARANTIYD